MSHGHDEDRDHMQELLREQLGREPTPAEVDDLLSAWRAFWAPRRATATRALGSPTPEVVYEATCDRIRRAYGPGAVRAHLLGAALWERWAAECNINGDPRGPWCRSVAAKRRAYAEQARSRFRARAAARLRIAAGSDP